MQNILIVDDDQQIRELVRTIFTMSGFHASLAPDGMSAVRELHSSRPDAVLLDHDMPFMTGLDALREFKKIAPEVPVVIFSGSADSRLRQKAFLAGAADVISKPFGIETLVTAVKNAMGTGASAVERIHIQGMTE